MSFFGFDPLKPTAQSHNSNAPGFGPTPDPFAGFSSRGSKDEAGEALEFDENDGLGDQLEESRDAFNDATFGSSTIVGTDFDFSGHGEAVQPPILKQNVSGIGKSQPPPPTNLQKPAQSGYEKYKRADQLQNLEPDASIWGLGPSSLETSREQPRPVEPPSIAAVTRNMMTLDEVEAMMRVQPKHPSPTPATERDVGARAHTSVIQQGEPSMGNASLQPPNRAKYLADTNEYPTSLQTHVAPSPAISTSGQPSVEASEMPREIQTQYNSRKDEGQSPHRRMRSGVSLAQLHHRGPSLNGQPVIRADQITQLSEEERAAFLKDEATRAKRNHKIHLLSRDNGLMTPYDKNLITRIQLQQLITATGGADEEGPEAALAEDFYYQVHSQIYYPRSNAAVPQDHFAQTYLSQLSWRGGSRRYPRGGETHMRRMEQQVQRAVEAAKARPKNKQLVVEGSLGKISFSNAKTPKPLLNIRRNDATETATVPANKAQPQDTVAGRKAVLKDIETVYSSLMKIEDCERNQPPQPREESNGDEIQAYMDWRSNFTNLNQRLWKDWKVLEPIDNE